MTPIRRVLLAVTRIVLLRSAVRPGARNEGGRAAARIRHWSVLVGALSAGRSAPRPFVPDRHHSIAARFKVIVGGSGGWQIAQTNSWEELSVDCVVEGRSESTDTLDLFDKALAGEPIPRQLEVHYPKDRESIIFPDKRTTFGVVEMTTRCGRRCQF